MKITYHYPTAQTNKEGARYFFSLLFSQKLLVLGLFLLLLVYVGLQLTEPYLYKLIINQLEAMGTMPQDVLVQNILTYAGLWLGVTVSMNITAGIHILCVWRYLHHLWETTWQTLLERVFMLDINYHLNRKGGSLINMFNNYDQAYWHLNESIMRQVAQALLNFVAALVIVFSFDWRMALVSMAALPFYVISCFVIERRTSDKQDKIEKDWSKLYGSVGDAFTNVIAVLSFRQEKRFTKELSGFQAQTLNKQRKLNTLWAWTGQAQELSNALSRLMVIGVGAYFASQGTLSIGDIAMFLGYVTFLYAPFGVIASQIQTYQRDWKRFMKGVKILAQPITVLDGTRELKKAKGHVVVDNVSFSYAESNKKHTVQDISFEISPGETVALVGHSGAGKTTLTHLLERFYDPSAGEIRFDDVPYTELTRDSLRRHIAIVFQENTMFHESIRMNIALGMPKATQKEIETAAKQAAIHDFIMTLPDGYNTKVGERGVKLSGGQRQRIAIARAILKDPAFIILDEATSALDSKTEQEVQSALRHLTKGRSTLIIAHRLSTITHADKIIFLENGTILDMGPHKELLKRCKPYQELVHLQAHGVIADDPENA